MRPNSSSFTTTANSGLLNVLKNECAITAAYDPSASGPHPMPVQFVAIWDTGATNCVITQEVVSACGLVPIGMTQVYGVNSSDFREIYLVNLFLPNKVALVGVRVTKGDLPQSGAQILIGMDVITQGDFAVTNRNGITKFSFRIPSIQDIDFVKQHLNRVRMGGASRFRPKGKGRKRGR